jgi:uncharacterized membrane protein
MAATATEAMRSSPDRGHFQVQQRAPDTNVGDFERWACALGGGALVAYGLTRGTLGGLVMAGLGGALAYRGISGHCPYYHSLGISSAGRRHSPQAAMPAGAGVKIERSITINRPPEHLFRLWRNLENLPRIMRHLQQVEDRGNRRSHWVARTPLGATLEWDAEIITEREPELIGWRSLPGSQVNTAGSVHFKGLPGNRGTEVRVLLKYDPPGGKWVAGFAENYWVGAGEEIAEDLRRFKESMETGSPVTPFAQPSYSG